MALVPLGSFGTAALLAFAILATACGGSSSPTSPSGTGSSTLSPTPGLTESFSSIQNLVFAQRCTACHGSARREANLDLQTGAHANLVNRASSQSSASLVSPGNPDNSYLVNKLEGRSITGNRMPQGGPFLAGEDVAIIRRWIQNGAPNN